MSQRSVNREPVSSAMPRDTDTGSQGPSSNTSGGTAVPHPPAQQRGGGGLPTRRGSKQRDAHGLGSPVRGGGGATGAPSTALDPDFDIYAFLNEGRTEVSRDPILQQMTVIKYEGDVDQTTGFFHGHGKLISTLGYTYTGKFDRGLMHGQGRIEWSDGVTYDGLFEENAIEGAGKYTWPNGDWYQGEVSACVRHGQGTFHYKALNATYEGGWDHGRRQGTGTLTYAGQNVDGTASTAMYSGEWSQDKRQGHGIMQYPDGGIYEGTWVEDIREGTTGSMKWRRNGVVVEEYTGQWVAGIPNGFGQSTYIRPPPVKVVATGTGAGAAGTGHTPKIHNLNLGALANSHGGAAHHVLDGAAPRKDSAINSFLGEYLDGKRHGFGTFVYDDGSKYEGQWVSNQKHGEGKYTGSTGVIFVGQFSEGNAVSPMNTAKPETTVSSPLPLYIRDVLGPAETNIVECITGVQSVISRNNGTLKKVFQYYSSLDQGIEVLTTPPGWRKNKSRQGTLSLLQFYRLCNDAKLLSKETTIAAIDRMLLNFMDRHATTNSGTYTSGEESITGQQNSTGNFGAEPDQHSPTSESGGMAQQGLPTEISLDASPGSARHRPSASVATGESSPVGGESSRKKSKHRSSSTRSEGISGGSGGKSGGSNAAALVGPYHSPWDTYKRELHTFQGELNFREYVEMLVRLAAAHYDAIGVFGSLANKLELVVNEHLLPFTCNPALGAPLFPITRAHRSSVQPFNNLFFRYFMAYSQATAIGSNAPTNMPSSSSSLSSEDKQAAEFLAATNRTLPTMTMRQFSVFLKDCGLFDDAKAGKDAPPFSLTTVMSLFPYDQHPRLATTVTRKQHIANSYLAGGPGGSSSHTGGPNAAMMGTISGSSTGGGHGSPGSGTGGGGSDLHLRPTATPNNGGASTNGASVSPMHSERGSTLSLEPQDPAALHFAAGDECIFRRKTDGTIRSRGFQGNNLHSTLLMEVELTFIEFVERLLAVGCSRFSTSMSTTQRLKGLMDQYLVPHGGKVGWFKQLHGQHLSSTSASPGGGGGGPLSHSGVGPAGEPEMGRRNTSSGSLY